MRVTVFAFLASALAFTTLSAQPEPANTVEARLAAQNAHLALTGDPEPEVLGTCFQALLGIDEALGFVSQCSRNS